MADPVTLALMAGGAALSAYASYEQAQAQQDYQEAAADAQRKAVGIQNEQISEAAAVERLKAHNEASLIRSRIRVAAGESGIGYGGTYEAMMRQADFDQEINQNITDRNMVNAIKASNAQLQPTQPTINPILAALMGGMQGGQSGMQIGGAVRDFSMAQPRTQPTVGFGDFRMLGG